MKRGGICIIGFGGDGNPWVLVQYNETHTVVLTWQEAICQRILIYVRPVDVAHKSRIVVVVDPALS